MIMLQNYSGVVDGYVSAYKHELYAEWYSLAVCSLLLDNIRLNFVTRWWPVIFIDIIR